MILIKNKNEILKMLESGKRLADLFFEFEKFNFLEKTTKEIDDLIAIMLEKRNLISQAKNYNGFSGYSCISLNEELVHGVPSEKKISDNCLIKIDICASYDGYCADMARMYTTNLENNLHKRMILCGEETIKEAFLEIFENNFFGTLGNVIENKIKSFGFSVVKDFCGHGIGKNMHEAPAVLNWGKKNTGQKIKLGMALAIEPMFCEKKANLSIDKKDKWTAKTVDLGISGHIEDTVVLGENGLIITTRDKFL